MRWVLGHRASPRAVVLADRHYSRQKPGTPQFVPPGRCLVLISECGDAVWVTSWPLPEYTKHRWAGAWVCSMFRNEGSALSSELITEAVAATRWVWPDVPSLGMVTFVDRRRVRSANPGYCFLQAGFKKDGRTKGGLRALRLEPKEMPAPTPAIGSRLRLWRDD